MNFKDYIPYDFKIKYQLLKRYFKYRVLGREIPYAQTGHKIENVQISIRQEIKPSHLYENKKHNLYIASERVNRVVVKPGEVFSFWNVVGRPNKKNQYKIGRSIQHGKVTEDYGGGLCQLSGLIYHLSLKAALEILERHNHSVDIYEEAERFAPLGSDATVVYGYKDLMIRNNLPNDIQFHISIEGDLLVGTICSDDTIHEKEIIFEIKEQNNRKYVYAYTPEKKILNESIYRRK